MKNRPRGGLGPWTGRADPDRPRQPAAGEPAAASAGRRCPRRPPRTATAGAGTLTEPGTDAGSELAPVPGARFAEIPVGVDRAEPEAAAPGLRRGGARRS